MRRKSHPCEVERERESEALYTTFKGYFASVNLFEVIVCLLLNMFGWITHTQAKVSFVGACVVLFFMFPSLFVLFEQRIVNLVYKLTQTPIQMGLRALATLLKMIALRFWITYNEQRERGKKYEIEINSHHNWFNGSSTDVALKSIRLRSVWLNGNGYTQSKNRMISNSLALIMRLQNASNWKFSCIASDVAFWRQPNGRNRVY